MENGRVETMETLESSKLCRLCGKYTPDMAFDIFDERGNHAHKINAILPISVHEMDFLPKYMCLFCNYKLGEFYKFYNQCLQADEELKSQLSWMAPKNPEDSKSAGCRPMVVIKKYKMQRDLDFDVNEDRTESVKEEKQFTLPDNLFYINNSRSTWGSECAHNRLSVRNNEIARKSVKSETASAKGKPSLVSENHAKKDNSSSQLSRRKLRSNRGRTIAQESSKTLSPIGVSTSKVNGIWDFKLLSGVEVKLEKMDVEKSKVFMNPCHRNPTISKLRETKNYDEHFVKWKLDDRKFVNV